MERLEGLHARGQAIEAAYLTNYAFAGPDELQAARHSWLAALRCAPDEHVPAAVDEIRAAVLGAMHTWKRPPSPVS